MKTKTVMVPPCTLPTQAWVVKTDSGVVNVMEIDGGLLIAGATNGTPFVIGLSVDCIFELAKIAKIVSGDIGDAEYALASAGKEGTI